jgi:uncharacterized protein (TIGR03084 family)
VSPAPVDLADLQADLAAEQADLVRIVTSLGPDEWARDTPAEGWTVRDEIAHLAYYDHAAALAMSDPAAFEAERDRAFGGGDFGAFADYEAMTLRRDLDGPATLAHWKEQSAFLHEAVQAMDPATRVPWYGPPMAGASLVTARVMETWAHGQDVIDALGVQREPTERLRHIAHLGVRTRGFSFTVRGLDPPAGEVLVQLTGPAGDVWTWGPDGTTATTSVDAVEALDAVDAVIGSALDFCLVVTQRRNLADTSLAIQGPIAEAWMGQAQAFAGPPGTGRAPLAAS